MTPHCNYSRLVPPPHLPRSLHPQGKCRKARSFQFNSVQSLSHVQLFGIPWTAACQASLSITNSRSLLKLMSIELVMPSSHLILCRPLFFSPSIFPSIRVFSNESVLCIRWPKYWSFSFNISPSNEHSGLISFRIGWLDPLAVQGTLKSLLQHHSSKVSILPKAKSFQKTEKSLQETSLKRQKASLSSQMPLAYLTCCLIGSEDALASPEAGDSLTGL